MGVHGSRHEISCPSDPNFDTGHNAPVNERSVVNNETLTRLMDRTDTASGAANWSRAANQDLLQVGPNGISAGFARPER
jgi:hypothetical protein